jgi:hypothetical protein
MQDGPFFGQPLAGRQAVLSLGIRANNFLYLIHILNISHRAAGKYPGGILIVNAQVLE